jgi:hypothetical protein
MSEPDIRVLTITEPWVLGSDKLSAPTILGSEQSYSSQPLSHPTKYALEKQLAIKRRLLTPAGREASPDKN